MKVLLVLLTFFSCNGWAQNISSDSTLSTTRSMRGFYESYGDFIRHKPVHIGPFEIDRSFVKCGYNEQCVKSKLVIASEIMKEVYPLDFMYVYDGMDLYIIFKSTRFLMFGKYIEVNLLMNKGRFCYFELLKPPNYAYAPAHWKKSRRIIDLQTSSIIIPSNENLKELFKNNIDLFEAYQSDKEEKKLLKYISLLNQELGY